MANKPHTKGEETSQQDDRCEPDCGACLYESAAGEDEWLSQPWTPEEESALAKAYAEMMQNDRRPSGPEIANDPEK